MPERAAVYEEEEAERPAQGTEELVAELAHRKQAEPGWQAYLTILLYNWLFKPTEVAPPPHVFGTTNKGSVPCVQGLDFRSPGDDGRMLMPTLPQLVSWVAAHSSIPFDPAGVRVLSLRCAACVSCITLVPHADPSPALGIACPC